MFSVVATALCLFVMVDRQTTAGQLPSDARRAFLSKGEILVAVEAIRSRIEDLSVHFSSDALKAPASFMGNRFHETAVIKGDKTYFDREFGAAPEHDKMLFRREVAFNGKRSTMHHVNSGIASVHSKRERETKTQGSEYFDLMLLNSPRPDGDGVSDQNLVSLLKSDRSHVREEMQAVNGHFCHVIDLVDPIFNRTRLTVWLDADRGFLPIKQVYYGGKGLQQVTIEFVIEEAVELQEGMWFAVRGFKRARPAAEAIPEGRWQVVRPIKVDGVEEGTPAIAVNTGVEDEFFDLWKSLPLGTTLQDMDVGVFWTIGGDDFEGLADTLGSVLDGMEMPIPERSKVQGDVRQARDPGQAESAEPGGPVETGTLVTPLFQTGLLLAAAVVVLGLAVAVVVRRRRTRV